VRNDEDDLANEEKEELVYVHDDYQNSMLGFVLAVYVFLIWFLVY